MEEKRRPERNGLVAAQAEAEERRGERGMEQGAAHHAGPAFMAGSER